MERNTLTPIAAAVVILLSGAAGFWITSTADTLPSLPVWSSAHAADAGPDSAVSPAAETVPCCEADSDKSKQTEISSATPACCSTGTTTAAADKSATGCACCAAKGTAKGDACCSATIAAASQETGSEGADGQPAPCCSGCASKTAASPDTGDSVKLVSGPAPCCSAETTAASGPAPCCEADAKAASGPAPCCEADTKTASGTAPCCSTDAKTASAGDACCTSSGAVAWTLERVTEFKAKGDWCTSHGVPESMCVKCNPTFVVAFQEAGDWCAGHSLPSSLCTICSPKLTALGIGRDWCATHGLPESQCVHCRPELGVIDAVEGGSFQTRMASAIKEVALSALTFNLPEGNSDPIHRTGLNPSCPLHGISVELKSADTAVGSGIIVEPAQQDSVARQVDCYAEVQYDESRYALVSSRAAGTVHSVEVDFGQKVAQGDTLGTVDSSEFGQAKAAFLRADAAVGKWKLLSDAIQEGADSGAVPRKELIESQAEMKSAEIERAIALQTLKNFGLNDPEITQVIEEMDTTTLLPIRAPFDGVIVTRKAVQGERVEPGSEICTVADLSAMWLCLDLPVESLPRVAVGMLVEFKVDRMSERIFTGKVTWVSTDVDPKTRLGRARAILPNLDGALRAGLFGRGSITSQAGERLTLAPRDAVQWDGCCNVVFVQKDDQTFEPRKVQVGAEQGNQIAILAGLLPGEPIVTQGSYLLKTEILKSNIGAGCCADHGGGTQAGDDAKDTAHTDQVAAH